MCGVVGFWMYKSNNQCDNSQNLEVIRNMLMLQKHRGPDDSGIVCANTKTLQLHEADLENHEIFTDDVDLFFGFNRLSILDLSKNGHQPMLSPDQKIMLVFNGEIYNAFDYKDELHSKGHIFVSRTDTEIVLHLYMEYGIEGMLQRLNGMFAISIYDFEKKKMYLIRDRFGIKPLYLLKNENYIAFSSEIKSFKALPNYKLRLDKRKLDEFLLFRYVVKDTLFEDIVNCAPGTYTEINTKGQIIIHTYYNINNEGQKKIESNLVMESFEKTLQQSVNSQMISDVKLGCQLSGGLDSSLITYFAKNDSIKNQLETISIVFDDPEYSEKKWIDMVVSKLNLISHQYKMDGDYFFNVLNDAIWHFENPISHPNSLGIYLLSKEAKKHVTVLLSGEGADECFGGYYKFILQLNSKWTKAKRVIKQIVRNEFNISKIDWTYTINSAGENNEFILTSAFVSKKIAQTVYRDFSYKRALKTRKNIIRKLSGNSFTKKRKYEMLTYLPELLLRQDKMSMAHSIENRVPFLDNEVVSLAFEISEKDLIVDSPDNNSKTKETKFVFKEICTKIFSKEFAYRKKSGFSIPEVEFMSTDACQKAWSKTIKPGIQNRKLFNVEYLDKIMNNLHNASPEELTILFLMFGFEIWAQQYLD